MAKKVQRQYRPLIHILLQGIVMDKYAYYNLSEQSRQSYGSLVLIDAFFFLFCAEIPHPSIDTHARSKIEIDFFF